MTAPPRSYAAAVIAVIISRASRDRVTSADRLIARILRSGISDPSPRHLKGGDAGPMSTSFAGD